MAKIKPIVTRTHRELADALGLAQEDGIEIQIRSDLNEKVIRAVESSGLTHAQVAQRVCTSRTRVTSILNRNTQHVSTELLLRILGALGYRAKIVITKPRRAA